MLSPAANFLCGSVIFLNGGTDASSVRMTGLSRYRLTKCHATSRRCRSSARLSPSNTKWRRAYPTVIWRGAAPQHPHPRNPNRRHNPSVIRPGLRHRLEAWILRSFPPYSHHVVRLRDFKAWKPYPRTSCHVVSEVGKGLYEHMGIPRGDAKST